MANKIDTTGWTIHPDTGEVYLPDGRSVGFVAPPPLPFGVDPETWKPHFEGPVECWLT
jgi:hypothetical protein